MARKQLKKKNKFNYFPGFPPSIEEKILTFLLVTSWIALTCSYLPKTSLKSAPQKIVETSP